MRIADVSKGFFFCFLLNMLFNFEWGLLGLILYLLHLWLHIPLWIALALLGLWVGGSLLLAILVAVDAIRPTRPMPKMDEKHTAPVKAKTTTYTFGSATTNFLKQQDAATASQMTIERAEVLEEAGAVVAMGVVEEAGAADVRAVVDEAGSVVAMGEAEEPVKD